MQNQDLSVKLGQRLEEAVQPGDGVHILDDFDIIDVEKGQRVQVRRRGEVMDGWCVRNQGLIRGVVIVAAQVFDGEEIGRVEAGQIGFYQHWVVVLVYLASRALRRLGYI